MTVWCLLSDCPACLLVMLSVCHFVLVIVIVDDTGAAEPIGRDGKFRPTFKRWTEKSVYFPSHF